MMEKQLEDVRDERASLLEINTFLSGQVAEAQQSIHSLQLREDSLQQEVTVYKNLMVAAQEEGEQDRIQIMQKEDEILSLHAEIEEEIVRSDHYANEAVISQKYLKDLEVKKEKTESELVNVKQAYNAAVGELHESKTVGGQVLAQMEEAEKERNLLRVENEKLLKDFEERNSEALTEMDDMKTKFDEETKLQEENITHLKGLRDNLEKSLSEKTEMLYNCRDSFDCLEMKLDNLKTNYDELTKTNLRFKGNLEYRIQELTKLKAELTMKTKECDEIKENANSAKDDLKYFLQKSEDLAKQNAELGSFRTAELEMCIKLREDLAKAKEAAEKGESAKRSMEAQQAVVMQAEAKEAEALAQLQDTVALTKQYEKKTTRSRAGHGTDGRRNQGTTRSFRTVQGTN